MREKRAIVPHLLPELIVVCTPDGRNQAVEPGDQDRFIECSFSGLWAEAAAELVRAVGLQEQPLGRDGPAAVPQPGLFGQAGAEGDIGPLFQQEVHDLG